MVNEHDRPAGLRELTPLTECDPSIPPPHLGAKFTRESRELGFCAALNYWIHLVPFLDRQASTITSILSECRRSFPAEITLLGTSACNRTRHLFYSNRIWSTGKMDVHFQESLLSRSLDKRILFSPIAQPVQMVENKWNVSHNIKETYYRENRRVCTNRSSPFQQKNAAPETPRQ